MPKTGTNIRERIPFIEDACGADETLLMTSRLHWIFVAKGIACLALFIWVGMKIGFLLKTYVFTMDRHLDRVAFMLYKIGSSIENGFIIAGILICALYFIAYFTTVVALTTKRLMLRRGLMFVKLINVDLEEIKSEYVDHGFFGRFLNYGEIRMDARFVENFYVPNIANPYRLLRAINEARATAGDTVIAGEVPLQPVETVAVAASAPVQAVETIAMAHTAPVQVAPESVTPATAVPVQPVVPAAAVVAPTVQTVVPAPAAVVAATQMAPAPVAVAPVTAAPVTTVRAGDLPPDMPVAVPETHVATITKPVAVQPDIAPEPLAAVMDNLHSAIESFTDLAKPHHDDDEIELK